MFPKYNTLFEQVSKGTNWTQHCMHAPAKYICWNFAPGKIMLLLNEYGFPQTQNKNLNI